MMYYLMKRSAILLLAFLYSHLTNEKKLGQLKNLINTRFHYKSPESKISARRRSQGNGSCNNQDWAATIIQTLARCMIAKNKYYCRKAIFILQGAMRAWIAVKRNSSVATACTPWDAHGRYNRYFVFIIERHRFVQIRNCAITIQRAIRISIKGRKIFKNSEFFESQLFSETTTSAPLEQCSEDNSVMALATPLQHRKPVDTSRACTARDLLCIDSIGCVDSATLLQLSDKQSMIDSSYLSSATRQLFKDETYRVNSATKLECDMDRSNVISSRAFVRHEEPISIWTDSSICKEVTDAQRMQSACRGFLHNENLRVSAATKIQGHWRGLSVRKCFTRKVRAFQQHKLAAGLIQRVVRGWLARKRMLGSSLQTYSRLCVLVQSQHKKCHQSIQLKIVLHSVISMQSFVRGCLARKQLIRICCCVNIIQRWWRKVFKTRKRAVIVIQSHFKAYLVRKVSKQDVAHIRSRLQKSSAQVDDDMRLINRLLAALSQLVHRRSLSSIRQTCATLSTATEYSKKCCETLVTAGAVDILLNQIHLLNRGVPDQEVLKQVLLTLRNIARFLNLRSVLLSSPGSVEIIFQELLRNKADGFFIAADILKKLCESKEGHETVRALQHHVKWLRNLLLNLEKKVELDKRNGRTRAVKETNLRRLGEAATLYHLLTSDQ